VVGDHVVEPAPDHAERHGPQRDVRDLSLGAAAREPASFADPDRGHDPRDDAQRVAAQG
jgi:hypothetical protein